MAVPVSGVDTTEPETARLDERRGGELVVSSAWEPATLNPMLQGSDASVARMYTVGAYKVTSTGELVPELVKRIPSVANGGVVIGTDGSITVTWNIVEGAVWSDGVPVTGDDFLYTWTLSADRNPEIADGVTVVETEEAQITLRFDRPSFQYETLFEWVVPRHAVSGTDFDNDWNTEMWPSSGPFLVDEWKRGNHLRLVRNPRYYRRTLGGEQLPFLDAITIRFDPDPGPAVAAFSAREVGFLWEPDISVNELEILLDQGAVVTAAPGSEWEYLAFSYNPENENADLVASYAFRHAVITALDRDELARVYTQYPDVASSDGFWSADSGGPWEEYEYDVAEARSLLEEACSAVGRDCVAEPPTIHVVALVNATSRVRTAEAIASMLREVGFKCEVFLDEMPLPSAPLPPRHDLHLGTGFRGAGTAALLEALSFFDPDARSGAAINPYGWGTDGSVVADSDAVNTYRELLDTARRSVDSTEVAALAARAERLLASELVVIPLVRRPVLTVYWPDLVGPTGNANDRYWNIEVWYLDN